MFKVFQKINLLGQDIDLTKLTRCFNTLQSNIQDVLSQIVLDPYLDGLTLTDINIVVGTNTINHTLGRNVIGYIVVSQDQVGNLTTLQKTNNNQTKTLMLNSDQNMVISLRIF
jgi:hypothetical protein